MVGALALDSLFFSPLKSFLGAAGDMAPPAAAADGAVDFLEPADDGCLPEADDFFGIAFGAVFEDAAGLLTTAGLTDAALELLGLAAAFELPEFAALEPREDFAALEPLTLVMLALELADGV